MTTAVDTRWTVPHEFENFDYFHMRWDVAKAWALVAEQTATDTINVENFARAMFGAPSPEAMADKTRIYFGVGVDAAWCIENDLDLTRPVLVVSRPLSDGEPITIPIDGYHRLYKAWHDGIESLPAILLTADQERKVRIR